MGAQGTISDIANLYPKRVQAWCDAFTQTPKQLSEAQASFKATLPIMELLGKTTNPIAIKWALHQQGIIASSACRLPLTPINQPKLERDILTQLALLSTMQAETELP